MAYAVGMRWKVPRLGTSVAGRLLSATRIKSEIQKVKLFVSERTYNKEAQFPTSPKGLHTYICVPLEMHFEKLIRREGKKFHQMVRGRG